MVDKGGLHDYIKSTFGIINEAELSNVSALFTLTTLKKGDYFLTAGTHCEKLAFVDSGLLRISAATQMREVTQWISTKGHFVTDLAGFVFDRPARWTIQAITDSTLYCIEKEAYETICTIVPNWGTLEKLFIVSCFITLEDRIFSHLSMTAEERYTFFFQHNRELFNQVPLHYIASMLGMTPETFSRIRKKTMIAAD